MIIVKIVEQQETWFIIGCTALRGPWPSLCCLYKLQMQGNSADENAWIQQTTLIA
jgi:hypothetical protein